MPRSTNAPKYTTIYGLAGIRLGYAIADPELLAPLHKVKEPFAVSLLVQARRA